MEFLEFFYENYCFYPIVQWEILLGSWHKNLKYVCGVSWYSMLFFMSPYIDGSPVELDDGPETA